jgi:beta-lactamase class A
MARIRRETPPGMKRSAFLYTTLSSFALLRPMRARAAGSIADELAAIERSTGGRLGVAIMDTAGGDTITHRAGERFPMCSTFKFLAVAAVLQRVDSGAEKLDRRVSYSSADLLEYAPVTREHVKQGYMTVEALCDAAIRFSDNTAANLLLRSLGGPQGVTQYARTLGDAVTSLNRMEPELNTGIPGDSRDTTTPAAMASDMHKILLGNVISAPMRARLTTWLVQCRTGENLLRAGVPKSWRAGDKTGLGGRHNKYGDSDTRNDIAILWPPHRPPLIVAAYLTGSQLPAAQRDAALTAVGRVVTSVRD